MKYLARLISEKRSPLVLPKLLTGQAQPIDELLKLPEPPFSSFSSTVGRHILEKSLVSSINRQKLKGDDSGWIPLDRSRQSVKREATRKKPSPVALDWLQEHRQALKAAGWTGREIYRANKSKGICWCGLWDKPFLKVYLHSDGVIEFECVDGGRDCIQTARPESFWNKNKKGYDND